MKILPATLGPAGLAAGAGLAWSEETARLSRAHNDANVLALGGRVVDHELAERILEVWLKTPFDGGRHATRVEAIDGTS